MSTLTDSAWPSAAHREVFPADAVDEITRFTDSLAAGTSLVATGSLAEGFGNPNSDIDLYVVHDASTPNVAVAIGMRKMRYVDCEHMTHASLRQLVTRVEQTSWSTVVDQQLRDVDRYYRLAIGVPIALTDSFAETFAGFDRVRARAAFATFAWWRAYEHHARAACLLALGEANLARVAVREAALWHGTSVLAGEGEAYTSVKWIGEKAARRYGRGTADYYRVTGGFLRPDGDTATLIARWREVLRPDPELVVAATARGAGLAGDVRAVGSGDECHLVRGRTAVVRVRGLAAWLSLALSTGATWPAAVAAAAAHLGLPDLEVAAAGWAMTKPLRDTGVLTTKQEG